MWQGFIVENKYHDAEIKIELFQCINHFHPPNAKNLINKINRCTYQHFSSLLVHVRWFIQMAAVWLSTTCTSLGYDHFLFLQISNPPSRVHLYNSVDAICRTGTQMGSHPPYVCIGSLYRCIVAWTQLGNRTGHGTATLAAPLLFTSGPVII